MLFDLFRGGFTLETFMMFATRVFVVFCVLPFHEYAHALIADKLGDPTPRQNGRLTLNPLSHIDPIGGLMIFLVGFGYAKGVPVNPRYFKNKKGGMALTALAGPVSNLILAFISVFLMVISNKFLTGVLRQVVYFFFSFNAVINISLAVFNLLPVPPLDGSRLAAVVLPDKYYYKLVSYERYIMYVVLILAATGALSRPIVFLSKEVFLLFFKIVSFFFNLKGKN